jgi:pyrroloquinoline quinone (PQQ) biosynthesis protein C
MDRIGRSVPFALRGKTVGEIEWLLDPYSFSAQEVPGKSVLAKVRNSLDLSLVGSSFPAAVAEELLADQYDACMTFMFAHPLWELMRSSKGSDSLHAYVLETRHYLHAAPWRMAPGAAAAQTDPQLAAHLAEHVVEEADHARFFEDALSVLGCSERSVREAEPLPGTIEWIFLMRALSHSNAFTAGVASGVMEYTANDRALVNAWHRDLKRRKLMSSAAIEAFRRHVDLDEELGHGDNWREMLHEQQVIDAKSMARALNAAATVAEGVDRWSDQAVGGLAATAVQEMSSGELDRDDGDPDVIDPILGARFVWPAAVLHEVAYGGGEPSGYRRAVATAYFLNRNGRAPGQVHAQAQYLRDQLAVRVLCPGTDAGWTDMLRSWHRCIDGHLLWSEMETASDETLAYGWLLENYHYLQSSPLHVAAAVAACPDVALRANLVKHLAEEAGHGGMLLRALAKFMPAKLVRVQRPLSSTLAFTGLLADLARSDWKAYVLALGFLQFTLSSDGRRQRSFYEGIGTVCPRAKFLFAAMHAHDMKDAQLGHEGDANELVTLLVSRHDVSEESVARAARIATMAWSFLDGIRRHYSTGPASIVQRMGWRAQGL